MFKPPAFARISWGEGTGVEFHTFAQAFDDAEALVVHGALDHLDYVVDLEAWVRAMKVAPLATSFFTALTGWSHHGAARLRIGIATSRSLFSAGWHLVC